jgi:hypothetical protein
MKIDIRDRLSRLYTQVSSPNQRTMANPIENGKTTIKGINITGFRGTPKVGLKPDHHRRK